MGTQPRKSPYNFLPSLSRARRGGTVQRIQELIRDAVVRLELVPGAMIDKTALCNRLGVSRFPVSEALGRLADEGFIEILPQRGTRVARIHLNDMREAMFIRRALEAEAIRVIAPSISSGLLVEIQRNMRDQKTAMEKNDRARFHALDLEFHELLLGALGYERVIAAVDAARANLDRMRLFLCTPARQAATFAEHRAIVAALVKRDGAAAARAMEEHLDAAMNALSDFAAKHPDSFETQIRGNVAA